MLAQPFVDVVAQRRGDDRRRCASNLAAADLELDADALAELDALEEDSDGYWAARGEMAWT